jgi:hypothetical protein
MRPRGNTDAYGQEDRPSRSVRGEMQREFVREKCASGQVFQRSASMTLAELNTEVRRLAPGVTRSDVTLAIRTYDSTYGRGEMVEVVAEIDVWHRGQYYGCDAPTYEAALELFRASILPKLGLVGVAPAAERLAAMDVTQ